MQIRELRDYVVSEFFGDDDKRNALKDISLSLLKRYPYHTESPILTLNRHPFTRGIAIDFIAVDTPAGLGQLIREVMVRQLVPTTVTGLVLWNFSFGEEKLDIYPEIIFSEYDSILAGGLAINNYSTVGVNGYNIIARFYAFLAELHRLPIYYHDVDPTESGPMLARLRKYKERAQNETVCH